MCKKHIIATSSSFSIGQKRCADHVQSVYLSKDLSYRTSELVHVTGTQLHGAFEINFT